MVYGDALIDTATGEIIGLRLSTAPIRADRPHRTSDTRALREVRFSIDGPRTLVGRNAEVRRQIQRRSGALAWKPDAPPFRRTLSIAVQRDRERPADAVITDEP